MKKVEPHEVVKHAVRAAKAKAKQVALERKPDSTSDKFYEEIGEVAAKEAIKVLFGTLFDGLGELLD